jgi:DNA helicase-2/ATP-dependent DNA helicase PcrA
MLKVIEKFRLSITENLEAFSETLRNYVIELGYYDELKEEDEEGRLENVDALFDDVLRYINENPASGFENYLENVALTSAQDDVENGDYISLMTIHTAKGLEFKHVFVIGLNQGVFPSVRTLNEDAYLGMEEERRLCYVALTRAQETLCLSCSGDYSYTLQSNMIPSQFFEEAGVHFIKASDSYERGSMQHTFVDLFKDTTQKTTFQTNNISDWKVGDGVAHDTFGLGVVVTIIDTEIIEVLFETLGKKKLIANHPKLKRRTKDAALD